MFPAYQSNRSKAYIYGQFCNPYLPLRTTGHFIQPIDFKFNTALYCNSINYYHFSPKSSLHFHRQCLRKESCVKIVRSFQKTLFQNFGLDSSLNAQSAQKFQKHNFSDTLPQLLFTFSKIDGQVLPFQKISKFCNPQILLIGLIVFKFYKALFFHRINYLISFTTIKFQSSPTDCRNETPLKSSEGILEKSFPKLGIRTNSLLVIMAQNFKNTVFGNTRSHGRVSAESVVRSFHLKNPRNFETPIHPRISGLTSKTT